MSWLPGYSGIPEARLNVVRAGVIIQMYNGSFESSEAKISTWHTYMYMYTTVALLVRKLCNGHRYIIYVHNCWLFSS